VIEAGSAGGGVQDTTGISLEDRSIGLNGDGDDSLGNSSLELGNRVGWNAGVRSNVGSGLLLVRARSTSGSVWVLSLSLDVVGLKIVEGMVLPSSLASVRSFVAVDNLLLGERSKLTGGLEVVVLDGGDGREGPA